MLFTFFIGRLVNMWGLPKFLKNCKTIYGEKLWLIHLYASYTAYGMNVIWFVKLLIRFKRI